MSTSHLCVPPGVPETCRFARSEINRLEWRLADGGDPALLLEDFCQTVVSASNDLAVPGAHDESAAVCGVAVLVSAAAGAVMIGGAPGAPTPSAAVPDLVAVAYRHAPAPARIPRGDGFVLAGPWRQSWTANDHADAVRQVRAAIGRGDVYQVNVVGHQSAAYTGDTGVLSRLAAWPQARFGGVMSGRGWTVASASPECLARVEQGVVVTKPIKGTAPATAAGARQLRESVKERAEHVMIVDLERNDLAQVAVPGSIAVEQLFALREWGGLWQAESFIRARLAAGTGLASLMRALCPPGSVTGTPKLAALEHIAGLEAVGRGPAMGAMGYITAEGLTLGLTIRTVAAAAGRVHVWAGGGITWRSDPFAEVAEAAAKAAPVRQALAASMAGNEVKAS